MQFYGIHLLEYQSPSFWNTLQTQVNIDQLQELCHKTKNTRTRHFYKDYQHWQNNSIKAQKSNDIILPLQFLTNY